MTTQKIITTTVRIPEDLRDHLAQLAESEERSLNTFIVRALRRVAAEQEN